LASHSILVITQSVIVLGAGPAGLAAAYQLTLQGHRVTLISELPAIGDHLSREDDPPHAILGCHRATWSLLRSLGIPSSPARFDEARLEFLLPNGHLVRYPKTSFPTPLHQVLTIGRFGGLSWGERWKLLSWLEQIWEGSLQLATDLEHRAAQDWLESSGQDRSVIRDIWNPLAHWLTGNDLHELSADAFIASAKPFFLSHAINSRIFVPRQPWLEMFVQPIVDHLARSGTTVLLGNQAIQLQYEQEHITGLRTSDGRFLQAEWYVMAVPQHQLTPLLPERWLTHYAYFQQIVELTTRPYTLIQVRAPGTLQSPRHILIGAGPFPWIACKRSESDQNLIAVLPLPHDQSPIETEQEVSRLLKSLGILQTETQISDFKQQEMAHAVLSLQPGTKVRRPIQSSPIPNLLLAGAWTDTGWPANLESAIVSGNRCAEIISGHKTA
jgi:uncharacterized protein with NAD-binding domain and iron-sulfur cluster